MEPRLVSHTHTHMCARNTFVVPRRLVEWTFLDRLDTLYGEKIGESGRNEKR